MSRRAWGTQPEDARATRADPDARVRRSPGVAGLAAAARRSRARGRRVGAGRRRGPPRHGRSRGRHERALGPAGGGRRGADPRAPAIRRRVCAVRHPRRGGCDATPLGRVVARGGGRRGLARGGTRRRCGHRAAASARRRDCSGAPSNVCEQARAAGASAAASPRARGHPRRPRVALARDRCARSRLRARHRGGRRRAGRRVPCRVDRARRLPLPQTRARAVRAGRAVAPLRREARARRRAERPAGERDSRAEDARVARDRGRGDGAACGVRRPARGARRAGPDSDHRGAVPAGHQRDAGLPGRPRGNHVADRPRRQDRGSHGGRAGAGGGGTRRAARAVRARLPADGRRARGARCPGRRGRREPAPVPAGVPARRCRDLEPAGDGRRSPGLPGLGGRRAPRHAPVGPLLPRAQRRGRRRAGIRHPRVARGVRARAAPRRADEPRPGPPRRAPRHADRPGSRARRAVAAHLLDAPRAQGGNHAPAARISRGAATSGCCACACSTAMLQGSDGSAAAIRTAPSGARRRPRSLP